MVAVVVPTIREKEYNKFLSAWEPLFDKHNVILVTVFDGENPYVECDGKQRTLDEVMGDNADLIYNKSDVVRNLGFAFIAKHLPDVSYIITLDDDTRPLYDTIGQHVNVLQKSVPVSWMSTAGTDYMRGFPYELRNEAEVVLSHGVWEQNPDWDAPTQLVTGNRDRTEPFYKGPIPKGVYYPMCGMNIAFKRKLLPYMYFAPMGHRVGLDRFGDIWLGVSVKDVIDEKGWAVYTGGAVCVHSRASNVFKNLQKEARGLELNETFWKGEADDEYFDEYEDARTRWKDFIHDCNL